MDGNREEVHLPPSYQTVLGCLGSQPSLIRVVRGNTSHFMCKVKVQENIGEEGR